MVIHRAVCLALLLFEFLQKSHRNIPSTERKIGLMFRKLPVLLPMGGLGGVMLPVRGETNFFFVTNVHLSVYFQYPYKTIKVASFSF